MIESNNTTFDVVSNKMKQPESDSEKEAHQQNDTQEEKKPNQKIIKFNYLCICFYAFLTGTDFALVIPTLWDRLHIDFNASGTFMGVVISMYSASGVLCGLVMGKISDDRPTKIKIFYLFCTFFSIFGHVLYFIGINKWVVLLARIISGLCLGCTTVALAYIAKTSSLKQRTSLISLVMASRQLGLMLGPAFNLFLRETHFLLFDTFVVDRKSSPGLFMAIVWLLIFLVFLFIYKDPEPEKKIQDEKIDLIKDLAKSHSTELSYKQQASHFCRVEILVLLATTFFTYFNQTSLETVLIPFTEEYLQWNELHNSILFCVGGMCIIGSYVLIRFLTIKFNDRAVLVTGIVLILIGLGVGILSLSLIEKVHSPSPTLNSTIVLTDNGYTRNLTDIQVTSYNLPGEIKAGFGIAFIFDVFGLPAIAICSASLFTKLVDNNVQGIGQGVQRGILGLGTILGPLFAGPLISMPIVIMATCFGLIGIILVCVLVSFRRLKPAGTEKMEKKNTAST